MKARLLASLLLAVLFGWACARGYDYYRFTGRCHWRGQVIEVKTGGLKGRVYCVPTFNIIEEYSP